MTRYRIQVKREAAADLDQPMAWYEDQRVGLGLALVDETDAVLQRIERTPLQFPVVHEPIRRALVHRFPYGVFFVVTRDLISVLAIVHLRRDPNVWRSRT